MDELKILKKVLLVPRLRSELRGFDFKGLSFNEFIQELNDLTHLVKKRLVENKAIEPDQEFQEEEMKRQLNNTF